MSTGPDAHRLDARARRIEKRVKHFLMSGAEAQRPENILALFERITGRPATADERAELKRRAELRGRPPKRP